MAGGPIKLWNEWATQILVLLSFALQIFLFLFARTRRHGPSAVLKIFLWLAYLMADSTAVYTLGHLSISGSPREQKLTVFWAPFLLVHLGSQDTITAYALEDNKLWPRHLLNLGVQAFGVAYVLYKHIAEIPTLLGLSTMLMFIVGVIKYGERIWALKCATLDNILSSIREPQALPTYYSALPCRGPKAEVRDEEELLLFAQAMLPLCKGAMVDFPVALFRFTFPAGERLSNFYIRNWNWKATLKVVEMELSLMYDILYTKAAVIHNWYGYCIRVLSPLATVIAFVLFQISGNGSAYSRTDVAITYILLVGAFLLDMASVLSALGSTWTCHFLWTRGWSKLGNVILSLRRHVKAAAGNRGWSGSVGQFNLLHFCSRDTTKLSSRVAKMTGLEEWWNKWYYQERLVISEDVKGLVFQHVWQALKEIHDPGANDDTRSPPLKEGVEEPIAMMPTRTDSVSFCPESYGDSARRHMKFDHSLGFGADLQQAILTCHILTDVFFLCGGTPKDDAAVLSVKAVKALSDYMLFLIAIRPDTILGLELRSLYEATRDALEDTLRHRPVLLYETTTDALENTLCLRTALFEDRPVTPCLYPAPYEATPDALEDRPVTPRLHAGRSSATRETKLASVLQNTADHILIIENINLSHGTICARLLLELVDVSKPDKLGVISRYRGLYYVAMDKLKLLMPDLESSCRGGEFDMPKALALILDTWVRLLIFVSVRCSRDAHARQINRGGELTTVVWLMAEHAAMLRNPPAKDYLACLV